MQRPCGWRELGTSEKLREGSRDCSAEQASLCLLTSLYQLPRVDRAGAAGVLPVREGLWMVMGAQAKGRSLGSMVDRVH